MAPENTAGATAAPGPAEPALRWKEEGARDLAASACTVGSARDEIVLLFGIGETGDDPGNPEARVRWVARIVLRPRVARGLATALRMAIPLQAVRAAVERASLRTKPGHILYLDVREEGNPRRSFDLNLYKAGLRLQDLDPWILQLGTHYAPDPEQFRLVFDLARPRTLGHTAGGVDRQGRDFLTIYYGMQAFGPDPDGERSTRPGSGLVACFARERLGRRPVRAVPPERDETAMEPHASAAGAPCRDPRGSEFEYLVVDDFLQSAVGARALASGLELGVIDALAGRSDGTREGLAAALRIDPTGLGLLCDLLIAGGVCEEREGRLGLSDAFRRALRYRDLLEAKLDFAHLALPDFMGGLGALITAPDRFRRQSRIFGLFDYGRCYDASPENEALTRRWMRITTVLTRYEAAACAAQYDFVRHRRMLDIGGNSGEFALQVCRRVPAMRATVFDLPLVCRIGREHVARAPEADRISFASGNALTDPLPGGFDLVTFKSVLHDWPEREARQLLARGAEALAPGGSVVIFERAPLGADPACLSFGTIPLLVFARHFRPPAPYLTHLAALGFVNIRADRILLDVPFSLVTADKPPR